MHLPFAAAEQLFSPQAGAALAAVALFAWLVVYPLYLSPLAQVPAAHPLAPLTSAWIQWQRWRNTEYACVAAAFAAKGSPYIRLGPSEIAVGSKQGYHSAYGVRLRNFDKPKSYDYFITHGCVSF